MMSNLAQRLRTAREHSGLSQGQVAKLLDMHRPTVSEIEAGRRKVSAEELTEFARIYEVTVAWLSGEEDDDQGLSDKVKLAARDLTKLKSEDLDKVLRLLSSMRNPKAQKK
jgi:transcriptional regulator with XRE-family HTH domain